MNNLERQELWATAYAFGSFLAASSTCKTLLRYCLTNTDELFVPLTTAFHAQYMRPFMTVDGLSPDLSLTRRDVPEALRDRHDFVATFRHKVLVHSDAKVRASGGELLNDVQIIRTSDDLHISLADSRAVINTYNPLVDLAYGMAMVMGDRLLKLLARNGDSVPKEVGRYLLTLNGPVVFQKIKDA